MKLIDLIRSCMYFFSGFFPRKKNVEIYGAWMGKRISDNSFYYLKDQIKAEKNIRFIWIGDKNLENDVIEKFKGQVEFVKINTLKSLYCQLTASKAYMTHGYQDFSKINLLRGSITIQFWHGFPFKKIVADVNNEGRRYFEKYSFFLSTSPLMDQRMLSGFRNYGITETNLLRAGEPRNCVFFDEEEKKVINNLKISLGILNGEKIIAYLPTFRDNTNNQFDFNEAGDALKQFLKANNIVILQRQHLAGGISVTKNSQIIKTVPPYVDTQQLLLMTNLLISDYSSVTADFLILQRPIIHFLFDNDDYVSENRQMYNDEYKKEFSGPVSYNEKELQVDIERLLINGVDDFIYVRQRNNELFNEYGIEAGKGNSQIISKTIEKYYKGEG